MYIDPAFVLSMFTLSFVFVVVCGLSEWERNTAAISVIVFALCIGVEYYQEDRFWMSINRFKPAIRFVFPTQVLDSNVIPRGILLLLYLVV